MTINEKLILSIEVAETQRSRHYWLSKQKQSGTSSTDGAQADILLAPWEKFRDDKDLFPQGTGEFYKFIQNARPNTSIALATSPEDYREVTLHGHEFRLPTALLKETLVAVFVGLCAEYLLHQKADPTKDIAQLEVIVERPSGKCLSVKYKGPVGTLPQRILDEVERCRTQAPSETHAATKTSAGKLKRKGQKDHSAD